MARRCHRRWVDTVAIVLAVAEELLGELALDVAPEREVVGLMCRREGGGLENTGGDHVVHPASGGY